MRIAFAAAAVVAALLAAVPGGSSGRGGHPDIRVGPPAATVHRTVAAVAAPAAPEAGRYAPARVRAENLVAEGFRRYGDLDMAGAVAAFAEAVRLDPAVENGDLLLGLALLRWGRDEAAIAPLERAARGHVLARRLLDRARAHTRPRPEPSGVLLRVGRFRAGLGAPVAVASAGGGWLVADASGGRVLLVDAAGRVVATHRDLAEPSGLAVATDGTVWVAEAAADRLTAISPDGTRRSFPNDDAPPAARPAGPRGVVVLPGGDVVVAEAGGGRLLRYAADGTFRGVVATGLRRPSGLARLDDGRFVVAEAAEDAPSVAVLSAAGEVETRLAHPALEAPAGVAVAAGRLWVADRGGRIVHGPSPDPSAGRVPRPLEGVATGADGRPIELDVPAGIAADAHGVVRVAEAGGAVSVFRVPDAGRLAGVDILRIAAAGRSVEIWAALRDSRGLPVAGVGRENIRVLETYGDRTLQVARFDVRAPAGRTVRLAVPAGLDAVEAAEASAIAAGLARGVPADWTAIAYAETTSILRSAPSGDDSAVLLLLAEAARAARAPAAAPAAPAAALETAVASLSRDARARDVVLFVPQRFDAAGLVEAGRYARAQLVAVHVVDLARTGSPDDRAPLRRLAEATGGRYVFAFGPQGARGLAEAITRRPNPLLLVRYENPVTLRYPAGEAVHVTLEAYHPVGADWDRFWYVAP